MNYLFIAIAIFISSSAYAQVDPSLEKDINVQGDAWIAVAPDIAKITIRFEENGNSAIAVSQSLDKKIQNFSKSLSSKDKSISVRSRGRSFEGADGPGTPVTPNAVVHATEHIAVESSLIENAPVIIEEALKAGASSISDSRYEVKNDNSKRLEAIKEATAKAREKALFAAQTLGVKLGKLISVTIGEEDGAALLMQQRMQGENPTQYSDKEVKIIVAARYSIEDEAGH